MEAVSGPFLSHAKETVPNPGPRVDNRNPVTFHRLERTTLFPRKIFLSGQVETRVEENERGTGERNRQVAGLGRKDEICVRDFREGKRVEFRIHDGGKRDGR